MKRTKEDESEDTTPAAESDNIANVDENESFSKRREKQWLAPKSGQRVTRVGEDYQCAIPDLVVDNTKKTPVDDNA